MTRRKTALMGNLNSVLLGSAGFIAAKQLDRIGFIAANPMIGAGAKAAIGLFLAAGKNKTFQPVGMGMALAGVTQIVGDVVGSAGVAGFLPYGSLSVDSVAGEPQIIVN